MGWPPDRKVFLFAMEEISYYIVIPAPVRIDKRLSANAKLLYGEISGLCRKAGFCWATNAFLAEIYGCSVRTLQSQLTELEKAGHIRVELEKDGDGTKRRIYITIAEVGGMQDIAYPGVKKSASPRAKDSAPPHAESCTHNNTVIQKEDSNIKPLTDVKGKDGGLFDEPVAPSGKSVVYPWGSPAFKEKWELYKEFRKQQHRFVFKSVITEQAALKKLAGISGGAEAVAVSIINQSIENGWKNLYELKNDSNAGKQAGTKVAGSAGGGSATRESIYDAFNKRHQKGT